MLAWNVFFGNPNSNLIETLNIFDHGGFLDECKKHAKKYGNDRASFEEEVRRSLMYYYWSKCEWEIIISHWPPSRYSKERKVDVYDQVRLNWDVFMDYLWGNRRELQCL